MIRCSQNEVLIQRNPSSGSIWSNLKKKEIRRRENIQSAVRVRWRFEKVQWLREWKSHYWRERTISLQCIVDENKGEEKLQVWQKPPGGRVRTAMSANGMGKIRKWGTFSWWKGRLFLFQFETLSSYPNKGGCQTVKNSGLHLKIQFRAGDKDMKINPHYLDESGTS